MNDAEKNTIGAFTVFTVFVLGCLIGFCLSQTERLECEKENVVIKEVMENAGECCWEQSMKVWKYDSFNQTDTGYSNETLWNYEYIPPDGEVISYEIQ